MIISIDSMPCVCEPGEFLIDVAARNGIAIPSLCHHDGLSGQGCCRVCIAEVEIDGRRSIVTACIYPVESECAVFTNSENINRQRRMILSLLHALAPESVDVARLCEEYEAPLVERFEEKKDGKCILCGLCVKACESLGTGAIATMSRGALKTVATPYDEPSVVCVGCASCAAVCPTGAIAVMEDGAERTIWKKSLPLKSCKNCGSIMGTHMEHWRAASSIGADVPALCDKCRKKTVATVMAATYGK